MTRIPTYDGPDLLPLDFKTEFLVFSETVATIEVPAESLGVEDRALETLKKQTCALKCHAPWKTFEWEQGASVGAGSLSPPTSPQKKK